MLVVCPRVARAADEAGALVVYNEALKLMEDKRYDEACPRFEASFRLAPTVRTKMAIALCHERAGRIATAWAEYREAVRLAKQANDAVARDAADARAATLEPRIPHLVIKVASQQPKPEVKVDTEARLASTLEQPLPVDPGKHIVVASSEGHVSFEGAVAVAEGETATVDVPVLVVRPTPPPPLLLAKGKTDETRQTIGYVLLGSAGAALMVGGITGVLVLNRSEERDQLCTTPQVGCRDDAERKRAIDLNDQGRTLSTISTIAFAGGIALAVAGVYLVLTSSTGVAKTKAASVSASSMSFTF